MPLLHTLTALTQPPSSIARSNKVGKLVMSSKTLGTPLCSVTSQYGMPNLLLLSLSPIACKSFRIRWFDREHFNSLVWFRVDVTWGGSLPFPALPTVWDGKGQGKALSVRILAFSCSSHCLAWEGACESKSRLYK